MRQRGEIKLEPVAKGVVVKTLLYGGVDIALGPLHLPMRNYLECRDLFIERPGSTRSLR